MDIATIIGIVSGVGLIIVSILMGSELNIFINIPSMMIVGGGTLAATLIAYPLKEFLMVMGLFVKVFVSKTANPQELVAQIVDVSRASKEKGVLSIEERLPKISNSFLSTALQLVVDGAKPSVIMSRMQSERSLELNKHKVGWEIFATMGSYSPAFGMVGTLIGLIQMLAALDDPSSIGPKMAVALITTFYGSLLANLIFMPMSAKLKRKSAQENLTYDLILDGVIGIRNNESSLLLEERLAMYLQGAKKIEEGAEEGEETE